MGIEPTSEAWEASILPLYDARSALRTKRIIHNAQTPRTAPPFPRPALRFRFSAGRSRKNSRELVSEKICRTGISPCSEAGPAKDEMLRFAAAIRRPRLCA